MPLAPYQLTAFNYATDSVNRIHGDDVAQRFGFRGGLVPGVGVMAYMTHPIAAHWGRSWLERGTISAKFLKPVYDGDRTTISANPRAEESDLIELQAANSAGELCAVGEAGLSGEPPTFRAEDYPRRPMPAESARRPPTITHVPAGLELGSLEVERWEDEGELYLNRFGEMLGLYRGPAAAPHPGQILQMANDILARNVDLGPWIHTASTLANADTPRAGEALSMRGKVSEAYERRGHEFVTLDLALVGEGERLLSLIRHTAIIRLREAAE